MFNAQIEEKEPLKEKEREKVWSEKQTEHQGNPVSWKPRKESGSKRKG